MVCRNTGAHADRASRERSAWEVHRVRSMRGASVVTKAVCERRKVGIMDNIAAYIKNRHLIYSAGVVGHFEKMFRKSGYSLSALTRELDGIDFNLPPSKNSVREKARILLEIIEAPSHNVSTYSLMSIAMSFATFGLGFCVGEDTESAIVTLGMTLLAILAVILIAYFIVTGFESRVRQRLVQALHVLAEAGEAGE